jgi:hypothetical protein
LISTNDGLTLYGANCPDTYYGPGTGFWSIDCVVSLPMPSSFDQSQRAAVYRRAAFDYVRDHAGRVPRVVAARELRGWSLWRVDQMVWANTGEGREEWASWTGVVQFWVLVPLAVMGGVVLRRRNVHVLPLVAMPVLVAIVMATFYGIPRFRLPAEIALVVLASAALDRMWLWRAERSRANVGAT